MKNDQEQHENDLALLRELGIDLGDSELDNQEFVAPEENLPESAWVAYGPLLTQERLDRIKTKLEARTALLWAENFDFPREQEEEKWNSGDEQLQCDLQGFWSVYHNNYTKAWGLVMRDLQRGVELDIKEWEESPYKWYIEEDDFR